MKRLHLLALVMLLDGCGACGDKPAPTLPGDMPQNAAMRRELRRRQRNVEPEPAQPEPPQITSILDIDSGVAPTPTTPPDPRLVHRGFFDPVPPSETSTKWLIPDSVRNAPSGPH